jgi:hypothetical protein
MTQEKQSVVEQLAWIGKLPEGGGSWGFGIVETAKSIEAEVVRLEEQDDTITGHIAARKKLLRQTVKRADKEAPLLHTSDQIESAKAESGVVIDVD